VSPLEPLSSSCMLTATVLGKLCGLCVTDIHYITLFIVDLRMTNIFQVKVIIGEDRECTGQMLSIDGMDGVVKLDRGNISMLQLSYLCKMPRDA